MASYITSSTTNTWFINEECQFTLHAIYKRWRHEIKGKFCVAEMNLFTIFQGWPHFRAVISSGLLKVFGTGVWLWHLLESWLIAFGWIAAVHSRRPRTASIGLSLILRRWITLSMQLKRAGYLSPNANWAEFFFIKDLFHRIRGLLGKFCPIQNKEYTVVWNYGGYCMSEWLPM